MKKLGDILRESGNIDLDLTDSVFMGSRSIKGATRLCLVTEIALRYLNVRRVNGQHWFYRPVAAMLTGHAPGAKRATTKGPAAAAAASAPAASVSVISAATVTPATATPAKKSVAKLVRKKLGAKLND